MKSFDEWRNAQRTQVNGYTERDAFEAGQQSKQAEIDELRKRIDVALNKSEDFYDFGDGESAMAFCNEIINILKGKINDN